MEKVQGANSNVTAGGMKYKCLNTEPMRVDHTSLTLLTAPSTVLRLTQGCASACSTLRRCDSSRAKQLEMKLMPSTDMHFQGP